MLLQLRKGLKKFPQTKQKIRRWRASAVEKRIEKISNQLKKSGDGVLLHAVEKRIGKIFSAEKIREPDCELLQLRKHRDERHRAIFSYLKCRRNFIGRQKLYYNMGDFQKFLLNN